MTLHSIVRPALICAGAFLAGCSSHPLPQPGEKAPAVKAPADPAPRAEGSTWSHPMLAAADTPTRGDSELWAQTCSRCHNAREPGYYSPGQWTLVMQHMRVRGYLTGEESRRIAAFLKDSSR